LGLFPWPLAVRLTAHNAACAEYDRSAALRILLYTSEQLGGFYALKKNLMVQVRLSPT
jgi:hypothetical protein